MSPDPHIQVERLGAVQRVRIVRPEKKNALTLPMYEALTAALRAANDDDTLAATILCGQPEAFTAGNDIAAFMAMTAQTTPGAEPVLGGPILDFLHALATSEKPLVAAVDGPAVGVGATLLLHCDLVYATARASLIMPFAKLGLVPEAGSSLLLPRAVGHRAAFELLVLGAPMSAERAYQLGLVNALVASEELDDAALASAQSLADLPRSAMLKSRAMLRGDPEALAARMDEEAREFARRLASPEAQAAFAAFTGRSG